MAKLVPVVFVEGLAAVGKLKGFRVVDCDVPRRKKIVAESVDGEVYETRCIDERGVKRVVLAIAEYKRLSSLIVEGEGA